METSHIGPPILIIHFSLRLSFEDISIFNELYISFTSLSSKQSRYQIVSLNSINNLKNQRPFHLKSFVYQNIYLFRFVNN